MNDKINKVISFYVLCNKLKDVVRTGWKNWRVSRERVESVAEHIYGVQMLAIAMYKEFGYSLDIEKVVYMLAVHELEEIIIGDLTRFDISCEEKRERGKKAVDEILGNLSNSLDIGALIEEFESRETDEALFAYYCDKLECDIQAKLYDEGNYVDIRNQLDNELLSRERVEKLLNSGKTWSESWIDSDRNIYLDDNFLSVLDYVKDNDISQ